MVETNVVAEPTAAILEEKIRSRRARVGIVGLGYVGLPPAVEFAKAAAMRPRIVGDALNKVSADSDVEPAMFEILEIQKLVESKAKITLVPERSGLLPELLVAGAKDSSSAALKSPDAKKAAGA